MPCSWCGGPFPPGARKDSEFCGTLHRQAAFRFRQRRAELVARPLRAAKPLRMAYADPPYPGLARRYYQGEPSYAGEVNHAELLERLQGFDGWALSTGAFALWGILPLCPEGVRIGPWVKPIKPHPLTYGAHGCWEALIWVPGRRLRPGKRDWLCTSPARLGGSKLPGRKPLAFVAWLFDMLGLLPGDELVDLFPGSGVVASAWAEVNRRARLEASPQALRVAASSSATHRRDPEGARRVAGDVGATCRPPRPRDVSPLEDARRVVSAGGATSAEASRVGRRRRVPLGAPAGV